MEHITPLSCFLAICGLLTNVYWKYKNRKNKNRPFSIVIWMEENLIETLFSLMFTACALLFTDSILYFIQVPDTNTFPILNILYFAAGLFNQHIIKYIGNKIKKLLK